MKALSGLRMLDLTHMLSGPYGSMMLADLGAETIKIEPPGRGEGTRVLLRDNHDYSMHGMGAYFMTLNRNKKSITLNLKTEQGLAIFYDLVKQADIVLDNFSAGVMGRLKISHEYLSAINPHIITCTITGFGESGPNRDWVAFDLVAQGMGGGMSITGHPGNPPTRAGIPVGDIGGGVMAVVGILSAVIARESTGRGQHVDISMLDAQISMLTYVVTMYMMSGIVPEATGNGHVLHIPYDTFPVQDGWIIVAVIVDSFWKSLVKVLDLPELDTEQNETAPGRSQNHELINRKLTERFQSNTQAYWLDKLREARVPCAPVNNMVQALSNPQVAHRNMVVEVEHPGGGTYHAPGNPVKLSDTHEESFSPPPTVGQHTDEILHELLGKSKDEIAALRESGVI